jgi:putative ATP-dependent endonuclease of OLD family
MLSKDSSSANILLHRHEVYKQKRETQNIDTSGQNWMEPFGLALGLNNSEFGNWHDLFFSRSNQIILVEGQTDKEYLELLRDESHGKNMLILDGEVYPYDGIGNIKNGVLLNFLKNKYKKIVVTCDLDVEGEIGNILIGLGFEKGKSYFTVGLNEAGRRNIEGLVPDSIKKEVHANNVGLVEQAMNGTSREKSEAKNLLKQMTLKEFKKAQTPGKEHFKHFYELSKAINKALGA